MSPEVSSPLTRDEQHRAMRATIFAQCAGVFSEVLFTNGVILLYANALGLSSERVIVYLSLPWLLYALLTVPAAFFSDRHGRKRVGNWGQASVLAGMGAIALAGQLKAPANEILLVAGIIIFGLGIALFYSGFFALLSPIIPEDIRGRFFGKLRFSWQTVSIILTGIATFFLTKNSPLGIFQVVLGIATLGIIMRLVIYIRRIPEVEAVTADGPGFIPSIIEALRTDGYMSFCAYVFLLTLFTASAPTVFALIEKKVLQFGDNQVVWLGNLGMIGALLGYLVGGRCVDRYGTKGVFLVCHFTYGAALFLFLFRDLPTGILFAYLGMVNLLFGAVSATSGIAISAEMLALIPEKNKSISTSICASLQLAGMSLSGILSAWVLDLGVLRDAWTWHGAELSRFDSVLLAFAVMVILLVVALGLVPSVLRKPRQL
jgi:MFS family permease